MEYMAIQEFKKEEKKVIDLSGPEGNVFHVMNVAKNLSNQLGKNTNEIIKEMMSADYNNAIYVFDREFGDYVDVKLPHNMTKKNVEKSFIKGKNKRF